jgi:hypothetical protein
MACGRIGLFASCIALAFGAYPCVAHDGVHAPRARVAFSVATTNPSLWVGPAFSGSWYSTARSGEGFVLQILDDGSALAIWFTFPPPGHPAEQAWIIAQDGWIKGDRIRFGNVFTTRGPRFGVGFDPAQVQIIPWGTLEMRFSDCNRGEVSFSGSAAWGAGLREIVRLTAHSELECSGKRRVGPSGARLLAGLKQRSGAWFDPAHNGEGWMLEELPDGHAVNYWFTYDERGEQAWTIGVAATSGDHLDVSQNLRPVGTHFGADFDPTQIRIVPWGRLTLDFEGCNRGVVRYESSLPGFGSGTLKPVRLTRLAGTACVEASPSVPTTGTWSVGASMPGPQSEVAIASIGNRSCVVGGLGTPNAFKCYDTTGDSWTIMPDLPVGRDHALAIAMGGDLFVTGGYRSDNSDDQSISGWHYRVAEARWEPVPQMPDVVASGAAVLGGFAYFGDISGDLRQFDPRTLASRTIPRDGRAARDHSQLVAFQGELWMIGGRDYFGAEHTKVSIFDPASETWRAGPALRTARAGFAAAASPSLVILAGGERLVSPRGALNAVEAIAAGDGQWTTLPLMPTSVHGVGGALNGNAFYALGGSRTAGIARNDGNVQIYRWIP